MSDKLRVVGCRWLVAAIAAVSLVYGPSSIVPAIAADLTITAANVKLGGTATQTRVSTVTFGETVTAGQVVYLKTSDDKYYKADADVSTTAVAAGIVIVGASANGAGQIATDGPIIIGATMTAGANYVVSTTAGGVAPIADLASGDYISSLGHSLTTTVFWINIKNYGAAKP